jgi:glycosyltransferase 2 family protein
LAHSRRGEPAQARTASRRSWLGWCLALLILAGCVYFLDLRQVVAILGRLQLWQLAGLLGLMMLDRLLMAWKWSLLLRVVGVRVPLPSIIRFYYQASLAGTFLPTGLGGDVLRAYWVSRSHGAAHPVFASVLMEKLIGLVSQLNWALLGAAVFAGSRRDDLMGAWLAIGAFVALLTNGAFLLSLRPRVQSFVLRNLRRWSRARLLRLLHDLYQAYARYGGARTTLAWNLFLTAAEQALQMMVLLLVARCLGIEVGAVAFLSITAVQILLLRIPLLPSGLGLWEVTAIGAYALIGVPPEAAFALIFLMRILWIAAALPGLWFLLRPAEEARTTQP